MQNQTALANGPNLAARSSVISEIRTATIRGVDALPVRVELEMAQGIPQFSIIGLGDTAVKESRYRVQAALRSANISLPPSKITVNLSPASLRKDGAGLDLAIATALLVGSARLGPECLRGSLVLGELGLGGEIRPVRGVLAAASLAREQGAERIVVPYANGAEAAMIADIEVVAAKDLPELLAHLDGERPLSPPPTFPEQAIATDVDLRDVRGQSSARRALEIAAAGELSLLMVGNPGCGKTMLARRLPGVLPSLSGQESLEVTKIWSAAGLTLSPRGPIRHRPFRAPHPSISRAALVGGGEPLRPGEISLAHRGVLFLDEMAELPRHVVESLRQPLEDRRITVARVREAVTLPAAFMLVAATNPCPCGWYGHPTRPCRCSDVERARYQLRISGPIIDRMDMVVDTPAVSAEELVEEPRGEATAEVRKRVEEARTFALRRHPIPNGRIRGRELWQTLRPTRPAVDLLKSALERLSLSARSAERVVRVARTIGDLARSDQVEVEHVSEALTLRESSLLRPP